jgi:murein DD-endopeptidase MepM/ murein hydrolase activator NlpD
MVTHVIINHGYGYETLYGHMVPCKIKGGQAVKRGEVIGWVGSTGKSTGPHCHYEVHKYGQKIDRYISSTMIFRRHNSILF